VSTFETVGGTLRRWPKVTQTRRYRSKIKY